MEDVGPKESASSENAGPTLDFVHRLARITPFPDDHSVAHLLSASLLRNPILQRSPELEAAMERGAVARRTVFSLGIALTAVGAGLLGAQIIYRWPSYYIALASALILAGLCISIVASWVGTMVAQRAKEKLGPSEKRSGSKTSDSLKDDESAANRLLLLEYHNLTRSQAASSHRNSQAAMAAGLAILAIGGVTVVRVDSASAQVVAGTLAAVGSGLSTYLGSTFISAHRQALSQINHFFGQPLVQAYIYQAERLAQHVSDESKRDSILESIISEVLRGASQASGALMPGIRGISHADAQTSSILGKRNASDNDQFTDPSSPAKAHK